VRVVAVIGSYGKSTTAWTLATVLGCDTKHRHPAHAVTKLRPTDRHGVMEVGIHLPGQMTRYAKFVRPKVVVVTSIGSEHTRHLKSIEGIRAEKVAMVRALPPSGLAVVNGDDPNVLWMAAQTTARVTKVGFGPDNDVRATDVSIDWPYGTRFTLHLDGTTRDLRVRLIGAHQLFSVLAAIAVARAEGMLLDEAIGRLEALSPKRNRLEPVALPNGAFLLCDHCKSSLETVDRALDVLEQIPAVRKIAVLGDVDDPPGSRDDVHAMYERLGRRVASTVDRAVFVNVDIGRSRPLYTEGARAGGLDGDAIVGVTNARQALDALLRDLRPGDVVLVKGASQQQLDRIRVGLSGRHVGCELQACIAWVHCGDCPMLESGWPEGRAVA
jgi:UDP-N-acetylmuramyl pentapeptide synthase